MHSWVLGLFVLSVITVLSTAIYPEDHWNFATKLTTANFDTFIQENVDSGKTVMVRWIASSG